MPKLPYPVLIGASMLAVAAIAVGPTAVRAQSTKDKVEDAAQSASDKTKGAMEKMGDKVQSTGDKLQEKADRAGEKIKGTVDSAIDKTGSAARSAGDKIEQKSEPATDKAKSLGREAKSEVSDSWLTAKTKIALFADERVKGRQVKVVTDKATVTLRGKVDSDEAKAAAESIASGIDGVKSVKNELQVVAPAERAAVDASDKDIKRAVEGRLAADRRVRKVDVRSDGGVVTLTGDVAGIEQSARASEMARDVRGVRAVKNDLTADQRQRETTGRTAAPAGQQHVKRAQQALKDSGIDPGPVDGIMGPQTAAALETYQRRENLTVTGRADAETLGRLGIGVGGPSDTTRPAPATKPPVKP